MDFPRPVPGLVIRYSYLWRADYLRGRDEGVKDRPCAVVLVSKNAEGGEIVTILPVTHAEPKRPELALEIPAKTKKRLGLDSDRSWVVLTEVNQFRWPGPDLRLAHAGNAASAGYGQLSRKFFQQLRDRFVAVLRAGEARIVDRNG